MSTFTVVEEQGVGHPGDAFAGCFACAIAARCVRSVRPTLSTSANSAAFSSNSFRRYAISRSRRRISGSAR